MRTVEMSAEPGAAYHIYYSSRSGVLRILNPVTYFPDEPSATFHRHDIVVQKLA